MERLTEYHCGVAVIKDKNKLNVAMKKLAYYENLEQKGLILELPCKVGDTVYLIYEDAEDVYLPSTRYYYIEECKFIVEMYNDIGKFVFLTKEEAEAKLKEMESK